MKALELLLVVEDKISDLLDKCETDIMPHIQELISGVQNVDTDVVTEMIEMQQERILSDMEDFKGMDKGTREYQNLATTLILDISALLFIQERAVNWIKEVTLELAKEDA